MKKAASTSFSLKSNLRVLFKTVAFVYKNAFWSALSRDVSFVIITILELYAIRLGGKFIDATAQVLMNFEVFTLRDYFYTESFQYLAFGLAIWITIKGLNNLRSWSMQNIIRNINLQAELQVMEKVSTENMQEVERADFQQMLTFVPGFAIDRLVTSYDIFTNVIQQSIRSVSSMFILYQVLGATTLILPLITIAEPVVQFYGENKLRRFRLKEIRGIRYLTYIRNVALETLNFPELRVNGVFKYIRRNYLAGNKGYNADLSELEKHYNIDNAFFAMIGRVAFVGFVIYILFISVAKRLSIGDFKALFDYAESAYGGSYNVLRNSFRLMDEVSYTREFFELMEFEGFGDAVSGDMALKKNKAPTLKLDKVDFTYPGDNYKTLENISIEAKPGQKIAIVGGDGSGKSSLVKVLTGLYAVQAGDYYLGDYSVRELDRGELKSQISAVFQDFVRYSFTIEKNIMLSGEAVQVNRSRYEAVKKVAEVDKFMKIEELKDSQLLGKYFSGGRDISPGYWQRIAIARMLYRNRNIMIMDEPFTYIDGPSRLNILRNIANHIGDNKTLIYITRNTDNLRLFDKIYYMKYGKIVESGSYSELVKKRGHFYKEMRNNQ